MSGCCDSGLPAFQLQIPVSLSLESKSHVALNVALNMHVNIDLYKLQQVVVEDLQAAHE